MVELRNAIQIYKQQPPLPEDQDETTSYLDDVERKLATRVNAMRMRSLLSTGVES